MEFSPNYKLATGLCLIALAFYLYLLYQGGDGKALYLPPLGLGVFAAGVWIGFAKTSVYKKFGSIFPFIIGAVFMTWIAWNTQLHDDIVNSPYGSGLALIARSVTVHTLDIVGIHATNIGSLIILPPGSKVQSFDVINACSGADTTILFLGAFSIMIADIGRRSISKKRVAICFVLGSLAIYLTAIMRIPLLGIIGYYFGNDAMLTFHTYSGYLIFIGSVAVFWWLSLRWIGRKANLKGQSLEDPSKIATNKFGKV